MHEAVLWEHESESDASSASSGNSACSFPPRWETVVTESASVQTSPAWRSKANETDSVCLHAHTPELYMHSGTSVILCWKIVRHHLGYLVLYDWVMLLLTTSLTQPLKKTQSTPGLASQEYHLVSSLQDHSFCCSEAAHYLFFSLAHFGHYPSICASCITEKTQAAFFPKPQYCIPTYSALPTVHRAPGS